MTTLEQRIDAIDRALAEGSYRPGPWQRLVEAVEQLPLEERGAYAERLSATSDTLHARNSFRALPFLVAYLAEWFLLAAGLLLTTLSRDSALLAFAGVGVLLLCMQPLIKVTSGLLAGVRYSYAFLWYVEPRFKMRYGTYLMLGRAQRVALQLAGSVGTPVALLLGWLLVSPQHELVVAFCFWLFWAMLLMQVAAFAAEWLGIKRVGPFRLSLLTSPATAAMELRKRK